MSPRRVALLAAVLVVAAAAPSVAARKSCLLVRDAKGDGTVMGAGPSHPSLDILSVDVASGRKTFVVVLRLASVDPEPLLTAGTTYEVRWRYGKFDQSMKLRRDVRGVEVGLFDPNTARDADDDEIQVAARVHPPTASITWTVPRTKNPALARRGAMFSSFEALADPHLNLVTPSSVPFGAQWYLGLLPGDDAHSWNTYDDLAPSCVKAA